MDIEYRKYGRNWMVEIWEDDNGVYPEEKYEEINQWCIDTFHYHARKAYHMFELKTQQHLEFFILRWS